jgi:hypothetical protein
VNTEASLVVGVLQRDGWDLMGKSAVDMQDQPHRPPWGHLRGRNVPQIPKSECHRSSTESKSRSPSASATLSTFAHSFASRTRKLFAKRHHSHALVPDAHHPVPSEPSYSASVKFRDAKEESTGMLFANAVFQRSSFQNGVQGSHARDGASFNSPSASLTCEHPNRPLSFTSTTSPSLASQLNGPDHSNQSYSPRYWPVVAEIGDTLQGGLNGTIEGASFNTFSHLDVSHGSCRQVGLTACQLSPQILTSLHMDSASFFVAEPPNLSDHGGSKSSGTGLSVPLCPRESISPQWRQPGHHNSGMHAVSTSIDSNMGSVLLPGMPSLQSTGKISEHTCAQHNGSLLCHTTGMGVSAAQGEVGTLVCVPERPMKVHGSSSTKDVETISPKTTTKMCLACDNAALNVETTEQNCVQAVEIGLVDNATNLEDGEKQHDFGAATNNLDVCHGFENEIAKSMMADVLSVLQDVVAAVVADEQHLCSTVAWGGERDGKKYKSGASTQAGDDDEQVGDVDDGAGQDDKQRGFGTIARASPDQQGTVATGGVYMNQQSFGDDEGTAEDDEQRCCVAVVWYGEDGERHGTEAVVADGVDGMQLGLAKCSGPNPLLTGLPKQAPDCFGPAGASAPHFASKAPPNPSPPCRVHVSADQQPAQAKPPVVQAQLSMPQEDMPPFLLTNYTVQHGQHPFARMMSPSSVIATAQVQHTCSQRQSMTCEQVMSEHIIDLAALLEAHAIPIFMLLEGSPLATNQSCERIDSSRSFTEFVGLPQAGLSQPVTGAGADASNGDVSQVAVQPLGPAGCTSNGKSRSLVTPVTLPLSPFITHDELPSPYIIQDTLPCSSARHDAHCSRVHAVPSAVFSLRLDHAPVRPRVGPSNTCDPEVVHWHESNTDSDKSTSSPATPANRSCSHSRSGKSPRSLYALFGTGPIHSQCSPRSAPICSTVDTKPVVGIYSTVAAAPLSADTPCVTHANQASSPSCFSTQSCGSSQQAAQWHDARASKAQPLGESANAARVIPICPLPSCVISCWSSAKCEGRSMYWSVRDCWLEPPYPSGCQRGCWANSSVSRKRPASPREDPTLLRMHSKKQKAKTTQLEVTCSVVPGHAVSEGHENPILSEVDADESSGEGLHSSESHYSTPSQEGNQTDEDLVLSPGGGGSTWSRHGVSGWRQQHMSGLHSATAQDGSVVMPCMVMWDTSFGLNDMTDDKSMRVPDATPVAPEIDLHKHAHKPLGTVNCWARLRSRDGAASDAHAWHLPLAQALEKDWQAALQDCASFSQARPLTTELTHRAVPPVISAALAPQSDSQGTSDLDQLMSSSVGTVECSFHIVRQPVYASSPDPMHPTSQVAPSITSFPIAPQHPTKPLQHSQKQNGAGSVFYAVRSTVGHIMCSTLPRHKCVEGQVRPSSAQKTVPSVGTMHLPRSYDVGSLFSKHPVKEGMTILKSQQRRCARFIDVFRSRSAGEVATLDGACKHVRAGHSSLCMHQLAGISGNDQWRPCSCFRRQFWHRVCSLRHQHRHHQQHAAAAAACMHHQLPTAIPPTPCMHTLPGDDTSEHQRVSQGSPSHLAGARKAMSDCQIGTPFGFSSSDIEVLSASSSESSRANGYGHIDAAVAQNNCMRRIWQPQEAWPMSAVEAQMWADIGFGTEPSQAVCVLASDMPSFAKCGTVKACHGSHFLSSTVQCRAQPVAEGFEGGSDGDNGSNAHACETVPAPLSAVESNSIAIRGPVPALPQVLQCKQPLHSGECAAAQAPTGRFQSPTPVSDRPAWDDSPARVPSRPQHPWPHAPFSSRPSTVSMPSRQKASRLCTSSFVAPPSHGNRPRPQSPGTKPSLSWAATPCTRLATTAAVTTSPHPPSMPLPRSIASPLCHRLARQPRTPQAHPLRHPTITRSETRGRMRPQGTVETGSKTQRMLKYDAQRRSRSMQRLVSAGHGSAAQQSLSLGAACTSAWQTPDLQCMASVGCQFSMQRCSKTLPSHADHTLGMPTPEVHATMAASSSDESVSELAEAQQAASEMAPVAPHRHSGCSVLHATQAVPGVQCLQTYCVMCLLVVGWESSMNLSVHTPGYI